MKKLDPTTLEEIAKAVCGAGDFVHVTTIDPELFDVVDSPYIREFDTPFPLRKQPDLEAFLQRAGVEFESLQEIHDRKKFVLDLLTSINDTSALERLLLKLGSPKEHRDDLDAFPERLDHLNGTLRLEGLRIEIEGVEPRLVPCEATMIQPAKEMEISATPAFGRLVENEAMASVLAFRWEEARRCSQAEAYLASVVMMGGILEGVLLSKMQAHPEVVNKAKSAPLDKRTDKVKRFGEWGLDAMIAAAHESRWIKEDVKEFSRALRHFRNLVHPSAELKGMERPDEGTCEICWKVVGVAIRQLLKEP